MQHQFKTTILVSVLATAFSSCAWAVTLDPVQADEVVVTATRVPTPISQVLSDTTVITHEEIVQSAAQSLPQLLARQPGVEVATNGGRGTAASVFIRGANSDQTVILVDGMRMVSATAGTTALQQIPLSVIDRIEIVRGPMSSVYGADAIGGVIQIFTKKGEGKPHLSFSAGVGDRGYWDSTVGLNGKVDNTAFNVTVSHEQTRGFSAQNAHSNSSWSQYNPDRDGYKNSTYDASVAQTLAEGQTLQARAFQTFAKTDYDESEVGLDQDKTRLSGFSLTSNNQINDIWHSRLQFAHTQDKYETFRAAQNGGRSSLLQTNQNEWTWQNTLSVLGGETVAGTSLTEQKIKTWDIQWYPTGFGGKDKRLNRAVFVGYQGKWGKQLAQVNVRHDDDSQFGDKTTGQLAYGYEFAPQWMARAAYGTAFKVPTFNDLYNPSFGNPNLQPETAKNYELGLKWSGVGSRAELAVFDNKISNLIQYQKQMTLNRDARIQGATLSGLTSLFGVDVSGSVTYQNPQDLSTHKRLVRRARILADLSLSYTYNHLNTGMGLEYVGNRLDSDYGTYPEKEVTLPHYIKANIFADYAVTPEWTVQTRINNIGDVKYETVYGYNTAGREWYLGVRYAPKM